MLGMTNNIENYPLTLPLTEADHEIAQQLAEQQPNPAKATQVRLNALAVSAVNTYLQMMDIPTDLEASESRSPFMNLYHDAADLVIPGIGHLECRPVQAQEQTCRVPAEVWEDRIGYVAVQLDEALEEAKLIGFTPTVEDEEIPLRQFQPIRNLLRRVHQLSHATELDSSVTSPALLSNLTQWLQDTVETGWQTLETLLTTPQLATAYRSLRDDPLSRPTRRGKRLVLETPQQIHTLILLVTPEVEADTSTPTQEVTITVEVISADPSIPLPAGLQLLILEESGTVFREVQALPEDDYLRSRFGGQPEEQFTVQVALGDARVTEDFII